MPISALETMRPEASIRGGSIITDMWQRAKPHVSRGLDKLVGYAPSAIDTAGQRLVNRVQSPLGKSAISGLASFAKSMAQPAREAIRSRFGVGVRRKRLTKLDKAILRKLR